MVRKIAAVAAVLAAFAFSSQTADAGSRHRLDKRIKVTAVAVGAASTAAYFAINDWKWDWNSGAIPSWGAIAITTVGCAAVSPMVATLLVKRPLTMREGHVLVGSCVVPIVGGLLVNAAYNAHPGWEPAPVVVKTKRVKKKK